MVESMRAWIVSVALTACTTGCVYGEAITGLALTEHSKANLELKRQQTRIAGERAAILELYRKCLERSESDVSADCSEYRTALEVLVTPQK